MLGALSQLKLMAHWRFARDILGLFGLTLGALAVHGYHPAVEDAEIYLPGILKQLHPSLFPYNSEFFASHAGMTLFPEVIAGSIRLTHLPVGVALLAWHVGSIFLLLWGCHRIARLCFAEHMPSGAASPSLRQS